MREVIGGGDKKRLGKFAFEFVSIHRCQNANSRFADVYVVETRTLVTEKLVKFGGIKYVSSCSVPRETYAMITYLETSVFHSPAQTLVNTVNTIGVMGKGIAKEFKRLYPKMYREYRTICDNKELQTGMLHLWRSERRWVVNFPTKTTWRRPSEMEYVEAGLRKFAESYSQMGITSASFPPLGCGNGNLDWSDVKPVMESYLGKLNIPIYIHDVQVKDDFVPEHLDNLEAPDSFIQFWDDLVRILYENKGVFYTSNNSEFSVVPRGDSLSVTTSGNEHRRIDKELVESSWLTLRGRCLSNQSFSDPNSRKLKSYIFPIIGELPYVQRVMLRHPNSQNARSEGLFIDRELVRLPEKAVSVDDGAQECLFP